MALVDLRGRADDAVEALVARLPCQVEGGAVAVAPALLVGWSVGSELVGCLGAERTAERELELKNLFVLEEHRLQGIGRALVEALVAGAPVERFRVECGSEAAGFFERCGFHADAPGSYIRNVVAAPASREEVATVTLADLEAAIRGSWSRETSADPDEWTDANPSRGQCDATAALIRSYLGGEILVADVLRDGQRLERHAWNRLSSGLALDLTRDQFRAGEQLGIPTRQEPMMLGDASSRHALLAERVAARLAR